jgi:hypothetical protein
MRIIRTILAIGLATAFLPSSLQAQLSRGNYIPTCDANLEVGDITSSQVSANCREQDLASHVIKECLNSFIDDVDSVGQKGEELAATIRQLQKLKGRERIIQGAVEAKKESALVTKALKLIKAIRKGSGVLQDYASSCMSNGLLTSLGLNEEYSTLMAAKKAVDKADKVSKSLESKIERGDYQLDGKENNTLGFLKTVYGAGEAFQSLGGKAVKVVDSWQSAEARSSNAMITAKAAAGSCDMKQEDSQLRLAGKDAVIALAQARYKRAEAWSIRSCWAEHAEEQLGGRKDIFSLQGCDACREWQNAQEKVQDAEASEKRLETYLASVNSACRDLQKRAKANDDLNDRYLKWHEDGEMALKHGSCKLADARRAAQELSKLEHAIRGSACAFDYEHNSSTHLNLEIQARSRDADCNPAARPPVIGPKMPPSAQTKPWSGTASGSCHVVYEGFMDGKQYVQPAPPYDFKHSMTFEWNEAHKVYVVTSGSQRIVGSGLSFGFNDKCNQDRSNFQPGCIYKSRSNFTASGTITTSGDTITYKTRTVEDMNLAIKKPDGNCTLHKDKP